VQNTYHCINRTCGLATPRAVKFCPYCGTPQQGGMARPVAPVSMEATAVPVAVDLEKTAVPAPAPEPIPAPVWTPPVSPAPAPPAPPRAAPKPAAPPQPAPLHWGWWLIGLGVLWLAWIGARPATQKFDARIDAAFALAQDCKGKQAQSELIALRTTRATPAQLQRLQTALNAAATTCERKRVRDKAWVDASSAIDAALASSAPEKARTRLATFTRRWGEDDTTAAAKARIDAAKREVVAPPPAQSPDSARNLITEAERDISRGNYRGAVDKMETCVSMVDVRNRDCIALKARAERLYQGL
jgi:hypothetical protein